MFDVCPGNRRFAAALIASIVLASACAKDPAARKQEFLESGNRYFAAGQFRHAIIEYRNAIQIDARFGPARAKLAEAWARSGDLARALDEYVRAADLLPNDLEVQLQAGTFLLAARNAQDALGRAKRAVELAPKDPRVHVLHGNALAGLSSFDKALSSIEEAIKLDPARASSYSHLGAIELARGRREEAESAFRRAVALEPQSVDARLALGNFLWATGRLPETEQIFQSALELQPNSQQVNRALAALAIATDRPEGAEPYLKRIAEISPQASSILTLADFYILTGKPKEAIKRLEPLAAQTPEAPGVRQRLARAHAAAGDRPKAKAMVTELTQRNPRDVEAQLLKGQLLVLDGNRDDALVSVRAAAAADPTSVEAQFALGELYAARGDTEAAVAAFSEVLKLNPHAGAAQVALARLQLARGNSESSVRAAEQIARNETSNLAARLTLIRGLLASKDLERAAREIVKLGREAPDAAPVHALTGTLAAEQGDLPRARAAFERARALDPAALDALAGLIALDLQARNYPAAKAAIEARIRSGPASPQVFMLAAQTYFAGGDVAATEKMLRQAITVDSSFLPAYGLLGRIYVSQRKLDEARREFEELARRQAKPIGALTMSGMILQAQGDVGKAKQRYGEVLAIDPRAAVAANNLAWLYADGRENLDTALQLAQTATTAMPDVPELMDTLGWVYLRKDLPQLAIPLFKRCVEKSPRNAMYHYHLGLAYRRAGDPARAKLSLDRGLEQSPDAATAASIRDALTELSSPGQP